MSLSKLGALVGAIAFPLMLLAATWRALTPTPALSSQALGFDALVRQQPSEVVVIGASFAPADIDPRLLGERLIGKGKRALTLSVGASAAPVWYAILKERVYGNGLQPKRVILPVSVSSLMITRLRSSQRPKLDGQMPIPDDVVARHDGAGMLAAFDRVAAARGALRDQFLHPFRDALPVFFLGVDRAAVEAAAASVLGDQHAEQGARVLPTVETDPDATVGADAGAVTTDPAESYLADIVALAQGNGAQVVVVLPPTLSERAVGQYLEPDVEARLADWAREHRVVWIDERALGWDRAHFRDARHMRPSAAREFTERVAARILAVDPTTGQPPDDGPPRLEAAVSRTGTPPTFPPFEVLPGAGPCDASITLRPYNFLGRKALEGAHPRLSSPVLVSEGDTPLVSPVKKGECTGTFLHRTNIVVNRREADGPPLTLAWDLDAPTDPADRWWVLPGTRLTWTVGTAWEGDGVVRLTAAAIGPGKGAASLEVAGSSVAVGADGAASVEIGPLAAGWTVSVSSPADGPFLALDGLVVDGERGSSPLVEPPAPRGLEVFWRDAVVVGPVPPADPMTARLDPKRGPVFDTPWKALTDCSPLRVEHAGALLPEMPPGRRREGTGTRHTRGLLTFDAAPGTDPTTDYRVVYDPDRFCKKLCKNCTEQVWVYPGETLEAPIPEKRRIGFAAPLVQLKIETSVDIPADAAGTLRVEVHLADQVLLDQHLGAAELNKVLHLPLPAPVAPGDAGPVRVVLTATADLPPVMVVAGLEDQ